MSNTRIIWETSGALESRTFRCGYCGESIASNLGFRGKGGDGVVNAGIYLCHFCTCPNFFHYRVGIIHPVDIFGRNIESLPDHIKDLYDQARKTTRLSPVGSVLCSRKLLMHIAVEKGANPGESFLHYVEFLDKNNYVPPGGKEWVDHIRKKGNEATHEIPAVAAEDAEELIRFIEMLLIIVFEFPERLKSKAAKTTP